MKYSPILFSCFSFAAPVPTSSSAAAPPAPAFPAGRFPFAASRAARQRQAAHPASALRPLNARAARQRQAARPASALRLLNARDALRVRVHRSQQNVHHEKALHGFARLKVQGNGGKLMHERHAGDVRVELCEWFG